MARHLIIYGHGADDPGAVGNGTNERDFNRKILHPYLKKWADKSKDSFVFFDTTGNRDMFQETANGWGMYSINTSYYTTINEFHEDAASSSATGGHVIVSSSFKADKVDLSTASLIKRIVGWWGGVANTSGISYRSNLLNLNVAAQRGLNYRLTELGFITSKQDMDTIKKELDQYARGIVESITGENLGGNTVVKPKPIVYQTAPGLYEALANDCFYIDKELNKKSAWTYVKGQRMFIEDIVKSGKYTRAKVRLNNDIRYCTMRDDFWKLVYKTKEKKIK